MKEGVRFSQVYLERSTPLSDSKRFRNRLAEYYSQNLYKHYKEHIPSKLQLETGTEIPYASYGYNLEEFFKKNEIRDILDSITLIFNVVKERKYNGIDSDNWMKFVGRVFKEENMGYQLDPKCGVHYFVDEEFERNRFSTLILLDNPRYECIKTAYNDAYRYLDSEPMDNKASVRSIFEAIEILVKLMVETKNLNKWVVENTLKNKCLSLYTKDETSKIVVSGIFDSFAIWVNTLHNYRHGQTDKEPVAPTVDMSIYILSSGSSFLRWLLEMDNKLSV